MWVEFVVGSRLVPRVFLRVLRFSSFQKKPTSPNSNSDRIKDSHENKLSPLWLPLKIFQICFCYVMLYSVDDSDDGALDRFKTKVQIKSSGTLMWMAPKIVSSSCKFDVTYFPFDRQVNFKLEGFLI